MSSLLRVVSSATVQPVLSPSLLGLRSGSHPPKCISNCLRCVARVREFSHLLPSEFFLLIFNCLFCYFPWPGFCQNPDSCANHFLLVVCQLFPFWGSLSLPFCCVLSVKHVVKESMKSLEQSHVWKVACSAAVPHRLFLAGKACLSFLPQIETWSYCYSRLFSYTAK